MNQDGRIHHESVDFNTQVKKHTAGFEGLLLRLKGVYLRLCRLDGHGVPKITMPLVFVTLLTYLLTYSLSVMGPHEYPPLSWAIAHRPQANGQTWSRRSQDVRLQTGGS